MINAYSGINSYNVPIISDYPVSDPITMSAEEVEDSTKTDSLPDTYCADYYINDYKATVYGDSAAFISREINETKRQIEFLEKQVKSYPENISYACQLDKARNRLKELQRKLK